MAAVTGLNVTAQDIADFLGQGNDTDLVAQARQHLEAVRWLAYAYTRGVGFTRYASPTTYDLASALITATARLAANPEQIPYDVGGVSLRGGFTGWSLAELAVLNRYRRRAR